MLTFYDMRNTYTYIPVEQLELISRQRLSSSQLNSESGTCTTFDPTTMITSSQGAKATKTWSFPCNVEVLEFMSFTSTLVYQEGSNWLNVTARVAELTCLDCRLESCRGNEVCLVWLFCVDRPTLRPTKCVCVCVCVTERDQAQQ